MARLVHYHHLLLLAAAKCNFGVTLASYHTMLHHRKRGFAILSTEWARRAKSRLGLAHTHPQQRETARCAKTLVAARDDLASVVAARQIAQRWFAPLPTALRHPCSVNFQRGSAQRISSCVDFLLDFVNARMDPLQSNSSASEPLVRTSKGVVHRSSALCFARLQSWRAPQQSLRVAIQNERFVGVATFAKRIEV